LGAQELTQACAALERMGRDAKLADAGPALQEAVAALKAVETELSEIVGPTVLPAEGSAA